MLTFISSLLISVAFAGSPAIFSGQNVKMLKQNVDLAGVESILTGSADPSVSAQSAPAGSLYLNTSGNVYIKQDAGSSTNWKGVVTSLTGDVTAAGPGAAAASVVKIRGTAVSASGPSNGQFLIYNSTGTNWEPSANLTFITDTLKFLTGGSVRTITTDDVNAGVGPDALTIATGNFTNAPTSASGNSITVTTGPISGAGDNTSSGIVLIESGPNTSSGTNAQSGGIVIATGAATIRGDVNIEGADVDLFTDANGIIGGLTGPGGDVQWTTGNDAAAGTTGNVDLTTGSTVGAGTSGSVLITTGNTASGTGGDIALQPGTGATNGAVKLKAPGGGTHPISIVNPDTTTWTFTLPGDHGSANQVLKTDGAGVTSWTTASTGTVTSVAQTVPSILTISGSPITTSGTLAIGLNTQSANLVFAGPTSGLAATPTFRSLVGADLPNPSSSSLGGVQSITSTAHNFLTTISTSGVPSKAQPACADLSDSTSSCNTANASANTVSTIVARDGSGNFSAGTITAALTGTASGNTTYSANNHGLVISGAANAMTVLPPDASTSKILTSGGTGANPSWTDGNGITNLNASNLATGTAGVSVGGSGAGSFTAHGVLLGNGTSAFGVTAAGSAGQVLQSGGASANPSYSTPTYPSASGTAGLILRSDGTNNVYTTATYPNTAAAGTVLAAASSNTVSATATPTLGAASGTTGSISFVGTTSGTVVLAAQDAAGSATFKLPSADGSAGQVMKTNGSGILSFVAALTNPASAAFDTIYQNAGNTAMTNLANGTTGQVYMATTSAAPSWVTVKGNSTVLKAMTVQNFTTTGTQVGWLFTISTSSTVAVGDTYTNNGNTYTVQVALTAASGQVLWMSGTGATSGTALARSAGSGTSSITFSTKVATATYTTPTSPSPLYLELRSCGGGGGGSGSGTASSGGNGTAGTSSGFGGVFVAPGGSNGTAGGGGGAGGAAPTLTSGITGTALAGGSGGGAPASSGTSIFVASGQGAPSPFGGGGGGGAANSAGLNAPANTCSGGGGGGSGAAASMNGGGGGGAGGYVDVLVTSPAATYPYVIGALGSHGAAGTTGFIGGDGSAGYLVVEEHYQ